MLRKMPPQMGKLRKLGELAYFIVGKQSDCSLKELGLLNCLGGHLQIEDLRNVSKVEESVEANLKCKEKLKGLELEWNDDGSEDSLHERNVLEKLQQHTNIEQLSISGYAGMRLPQWVGDSSFSNIEELKLSACRYCSSLPPLGQLEFLKRLSIKGLDGITIVGPEFYGNSNKLPFGSQEHLEFGSMLQWQAWVSSLNMDEGATPMAAFPVLQALKIENCPNLKKIQSMYLPSLTELEILECDQLASLPWALTIQKLKIINQARYMRLHNSAWIKSLEVYRWKFSHSPLRMVEQLILITTLQRIRIDDCDSLRSFPFDLFLLLETLEISRCPNLEALSAAAEGGHLWSISNLL